MKEDKIKEVIDAWTLCTEELGKLRRAMRDDIEMAYGDQWGRVGRDPRRPQLSIDIISGRIRRRSGFIRQNMPEAKVISLSSKGDDFCDVMQQALKYIYSDKDNYTNRISAIDDALTTGLGWVHVYMDYSEDIVNGDVRLMKVSPFDIAFDPYISSPDFRDLGYIIHRSYMSKKELKRLYPKLSKDIDLITSEQEASYEKEVQRLYRTIEDMVNVFDYWYVEYDTEKWYVNLQTGDYGKYSDDMLPIEGEIKLIEKQVPIIKLRRILSNSLIVYDDVTPYVKNKFPYIPILCYSNFTHPQWEHRIKGISRRLKDLQYEKNKRRSSITENVLNKFLRGYMKLRDETADLSEYLTGNQQVLEVDSLDSIREIPPPNVPEALIILEKEIDSDLNVVDANLEMLDNTTTYQAVGALQLKLRETMLVDQEIYDNVNYAMYKISSYIVDMISEMWTTGKFKKIVGYNMPYIEEYKELEEQARQINMIASNFNSTDENAQPEVLQQGENILSQVAILQQKIETFWADFERNRKDIQFLIKFGEGVEETPTYKLAYLNTFTELKRQGQYVPDDVYIEFLDIPKRIKDKWIQSIRASGQQQQAALQMQHEHDIELERIRAQVKMVLQEMINENKLDVQKLKMKDVYEYDITRRTEEENANTEHERRREDNRVLEKGKT